MIARGNEVVARGRDPYFPAWPDVLQLNAFDPGLRAATAGTVASIAAQCDGVRRDMAMLPLNRIFDYQSRLLSFLENHDEPRAAATIPPAKHRATAVAALTLPGMRLLHEVSWRAAESTACFPGRRLDELQSFYISLLDGLRGRFGFPRLVTYPLRADAA